MKKRVKKYNCSHCSSKGYVNDYIEKKCPRCDGKGIVPGFWVEMKICPKCKGEKHIMEIKNRKLCKSCEGKGHIFCIISEEQYQRELAAKIIPCETCHKYSCICHEYVR